MSEEVKDVNGVVIHADPNKVVEPKGGEGDDKETNLAVLRKKLKQTEQERDEAIKIASLKGEKERSLGAVDEEEPVVEKKKETPDTLKVIFQRDAKEATRQWNKKNPVSSEEWAQIKSKIKLSGEETVSEIVDKIDEVHQSLPSVRAKRDKELIDKGRKQAMSQFQDEELDIGGGGDVDLGEGSEPRFNSREKKFLDRFGVTSDERKNINKETNTNEPVVFTQPTRKFFQP